MIVKHKRLTVSSAKLAGVEARALVQRTVRRRQPGCTDFIVGPGPDNPGWGEPGRTGLTVKHQQGEACTCR